MMTGVLRHSPKHRAAVAQLRDRFPVMEWREVPITPEDTDRFLRRGITARMLSYHLAATCDASTVEWDRVSRVWRVLMPKHKRIQLP